MLSTCRTCKGPVWSWDTVPVFFHSSDTAGPGGGFTSAALDTISRFPMVTIEKWQGQGVEYAGLGLKPLTSRLA